MNDLYDRLQNLTSHALSSFRNEIPFIMEGIVLDTSDPEQMGRVKIWVPSVDGELYDKQALPWCEYASPFAGSTNDFRTGRQVLTTSGYRGYGFWAIPKIGSQALVFFLNGDPNRRFYMGSYYSLHGNRGMPDGRNTHIDTKKPGVWSDTYDEVRPAMDNLRQQFQDKLDAPQARTRGVYERQVAQDKTQKDGTEGYAINAVDDAALDSQTYCWVTPGQNAIILQDTPEEARIRIKTTEGNQVIFDDANERIYISTARGGTWLEFDEDGHIHFFAKESFSVTAGKDINMIAGRNINIEAKNDINVKAVTGKISVASKSTMSLQSTSDSVFVTACSTLQTIGKQGIYMTSDSTINVTTSGSIYHTSGTHDILVGGACNIQASPLRLNSGAAAGTDAQCGLDPASPPIVPNHEPWKRPESTIKRNKYWKE